MQPVETRELADRLGVVVDAEIDEHIREAGVAAVALDDEQRCRLLSAAIAAGRLRRRQRLEEPFRERPSGGRGERLHERRHGLLADEDVALRGEARAGDAARPLEAFGAGVRRPLAVRVDDPELALAAVAGGQLLDHLSRRRAAAQQREPFGAVPRVRVRLRGDRAGVRLGPRDDRAHREKLRLRRDTPLARIEVTRCDRVRRDESRHSSSIVSPGSMRTIEAFGASS